MRVRILATRPPVKAWFPLPLESTHTISSFKAVLCTSLPAFCALSPASLHLAIDGFELLDNSELAIVRDGDLICVDVLDAKVAIQAKPLEPEASHKRKRGMSSPSSSSSESADSETSDSESESDSDDFMRPTTPTVRKAEPPQKATHPPTFVPPGHGKPQTRSRNLRRRLKRSHEREGGSVSGANAIAPADVLEPTHTVPPFLSLSLRNKNKAKNFKSLMNKTLPKKIVFGDVAITKSDVPPRLIPPSSRSSLPPNMFVTSVDVEAGSKGKAKIQIEEEAVDVDELESTANEQWDTLAKLTRDTVEPGMIVGYKGLGINPVTYTPEEVLAVVDVVSCEGETVVVRALRGVSFGGPVDGAEEEEHQWDAVERSDWRIVRS